MALGRLLRPGSIAVVGGREAAEVVRQCERTGFDGPIWPVNPRRASLAGRPCVARITDLAEPPDAAFVAVPAEPTIEIVAELSRIGAGGAVCYAAGFKEAGGEGVGRQDRLVAAAGAMPIIGPNCHGLLNYVNGAALWPDQQGGERVESGAAIVTQSGNMGINFTMQRRSLPLSYLVSVGNQAAVGIEDCVAALLDDDRVSAIGMVIEGLGDVGGFVAQATRAKARRVPLVALKVGRSRTGARIGLSHTASLAGPDRLYEALFERLGVALATTADDFLETLKFLAISGPTGGNRMASMSCSGGEAALVADLADGSDLVFPEMTGAHRSAVRASLGDRVAVSNPLDYHTFIWGDEEKLAACFTAMMGGGYDLTMLVLDFPRPDRCRADTWWPATNAIVGAARATGGKAAVVATLSECMPEEMGRHLPAHGIAPMHGLRQALAAFEGAHGVGRAWASPAAPPRIGAGLRPGPARVLDEWEAKRRLAAAGVAVPQGARASSVTDAVAAAEALGYPVAVKAVSAKIAHKTEAGAAALGLGDRSAVGEAAARMLDLAGCVLVERMVTDAVAELIVGVHRDDQFGPYLLVGFGGTLVELIGDSRIILPPADRDAVLGALRSLRTAPLLAGYRGRPAGDMDAVVDAVLAVGRFVEDNADAVVEIDINPLRVRAEGKGAVAVDAYVRMVAEE